MKSVLVVLTQSNLNNLQVHESLSATMVLATFGCNVKILLQDAALSLLQSQLEFDQFKHAFKLASNLVDSFEFYDLTPIYIEQCHQNLPAIIQTQHEIEWIDFDANFLNQFDHILYW
ncbi:MULTISPECIES: hypothetical protein [unclassified Acinetobacter]|uniref:hypothetical protein n=1 Tax=unclassified Acinetobacter TaxID=196816 RepID=UPI0029340F8B|nr:MULTISPECIES: hypothetical protein [unclassified Acinetobacter]WOE32091.1 hypothetical protein QSG84_02420 [Acinetobacter sp. SAAs470]WOE37560.1 hypothetical protein QSG86_11465 [Acinetobacter sp. SAAs474]